VSVELMATEVRPAYDAVRAEAYAQARTELTDMRDAINVFMMMLGGPFIALVFVTRAFKRCQAALAREPQIE
jgi:hypothetical protein